MGSNNYLLRASDLRMYLGASAKASAIPGSHSSIPTPVAHEFILLAPGTRDVSAELIPFPGDGSNPPLRLLQGQKDVCGLPTRNLALRPIHYVDL